MGQPLEGNSAENAIALMVRTGLDSAPGKHSCADEMRGLIEKGLLCHNPPLLI